MGLDKTNRNVEKRRTYLILAGIIIVAFALRFAGFNWGGDGTTYHPDEGKTYKDAMRMARNFYFLSASTTYPAQLSQKILSVLYIVYRWVVRAAGMEWSEIGCIYIARILTAVFGTLAVFFAYHAGERIKCGSGLFAAFFIGTFGPIVAQGHNAVMDEEIGFFTVLALLFAVRYMEADTRKQELFELGVFSAVCAAATLEKWYGGSLCFLIVLAVACKKRCKVSEWTARFLTHGIFSLACFAAVFGLIAPNLLRHPSLVLDGMLHVSSDYESDAGALSTLGTDVSWFLSYAGLLSLILIAAAVYGFVKEKRKGSIVLFIGIIEPVIMAVTGRDAHIRWLQPMFICLLMAMAAGCVYLKKAGSPDGKSLGFRRAAAAAVIVVVMINVFSNGFLMSAVYAANDSDTTNISAAYLEANGIAPENCIYDKYTCIYPGGVSKYFDSVAVEDSFTELDGEIYVTKLGRDYALSREWKKDYLDEIVVFEPDYRFDKCTSRNYGSPSVKWIDVCGMAEALYYGTGIASGRLSVGYGYRIDDISGIKGVQYIEPGDMKPSGDNMEYYLSAVNSGRYEVQLYGENDIVPEHLQISIVASSKESIAKIDAGRDPVQFEVLRDERDLVVQIPMEAFEECTIEIKEL